MSKDLFMTNEELVEQIQNGINVQENLGVLYEQNKGYIWKLVKPSIDYVRMQIGRRARILYEVMY